ncbi:MAG: hypothetical protein FJZ58_04585 [Chlamydiae bacterium]|nr:hypothetical protein [Chlamydiota bacterium]
MITDALSSLQQAYAERSQGFSPWACIKCALVLQEVLNLWKTDLSADKKLNKSIYTTVLQSAFHPPPLFSFAGCAKRIETLGLSLFGYPSEREVGEQILSLGHQKILQELDDWAFGSFQRMEAKRRILLFLEDKTSGALDLRNLELNSLPDIFYHRAFAERLCRLDLSGNDLPSLPAGINGLPKLRELFCRDCEHLETLFEEISLPRLHTLDLTGCSSLRALPENIGHLPLLRAVHIELCNHLRSFPESLLQLPRNCTVHMLGITHSSHALQRLRQEVRSPTYQGPTFILSAWRHIRAQGQEPSLETLIHQLCQTAEKPPIILSKELQENTYLKTWLYRLSDMADFSERKEESRKKLAGRILDFLIFAETEEGKTFKGLMLLVLEDAWTTCGDRMALSVMDLGIAYKLAKADLTKTQEIANLLLRGSLVLSLLQQIAQSKISTLKIVDPIEVVLTYPVMLKDSLQIPIDIEDMHFFYLSGISQQELEQARVFVQEHLDNQDYCTAFLVDQPLWIAALKLRYPTAMQEIETYKQDHFKKHQKALQDLTTPLLSL